MFHGSEQFSRASFHGNPSFDPYAPPLLADRSADPWSNDELLALLKLRSTTEIWFPDFTWEHVSRKLGELGYKRSGVECKDKFEEVSRHLSSSSSNNKNYNELDEMYQEAHHIQEMDDQDPTAKKPQDVIINPTIKRKRRDKLDKFKGFCQAVVTQMMSKQEELHHKLIHDILTRDEARIAREDAWRIQETKRIQAEIETRAKEQQSTAERQAVIIQFLKQFTATPEEKGKFDTNTNTNSKTNSNSSSSLCKSTPPQTPVVAAPSSPAGRRWPREEVVALINLRCETGGGGGEGSNKGPLWERISQGMKEMGYKRSAKRCKEKWENINKYFRKTKDSSKKRSVNSRTCPYFHQLSCLYGDGTIVAPTAAAAATAAEIDQ
ncbi:trihelix transcription factor GTL2-like [Salvia hispanica]|uniref:trihelix transcription factor GTL2-like n=1 Tax=Salvia hispanica TaxID=49212 RepID=UPI00200922E0|nr:trihelix transcription factor GTL2-like [Salvia hispanica]